MLLEIFIKKTKSQLELNKLKFSPNKLPGRANMIIPKNEKYMGATDKRMKVEHSLMMLFSEE